jgi:hypothetical protein
MSKIPSIEHDPHSAYRRAEQVKRLHQAELLAKANVIGVGVGLRSQAGEFTEEVAIIVMVRRKVARLDLRTEDLIPEELEGVPVDVQEVGQIQAQDP